MTWYKNLLIYLKFHIYHYTNIKQYLLFVKLKLNKYEKLKKDINLFKNNHSLNFHSKINIFDKEILTVFLFENKFLWLQFNFNNHYTT